MESVFYGCAHLKRFGSTDNTLETLYNYLKECQNIIALATGEDSTKWLPQIFAYPNASWMSDYKIYCMDVMYLPEIRTLVIDYYSVNDNGRAYIQWLCDAMQSNCILTVSPKDSGEKSTYKLVPGTAVEYEYTSTISVSEPAISCMNLCSNNPIGFTLDGDRQQLASYFKKRISALSEFSSSTELTRFSAKILSYLIGAKLTQKFNGDLASFGKCAELSSIYVGAKLLLCADTKLMNSCTKEQSTFLLECLSMLRNSKCLQLLESTLNSVSAINETQVENAYQVALVLSACVCTMSNRWVNSEYLYW